MSISSVAPDDESAQTWDVPYPESMSARAHAIVDTLSIDRADDLLMLVRDTPEEPSDILFMGDEAYVFGARATEVVLSPHSKRGDTIKFALPQSLDEFLLGLHPHGMRIFGSNPKEHIDLLIIEGTPTDCRRLLDPPPGPRGFLVLTRADRPLARPFGLAVPPNEYLAWWQNQVTTISDSMKTGGLDGAMVTAKNVEDAAVQNVLRAQDTTALTLPLSWVE